MKKFLSLAFFGFLIFLFASKTNACVSPFQFAKNFYLINLSVQKNNQSDGDWHSFYKGKLYSNIDFQKDAELHRRIISDRETSESEITIYPKHMEFSVKESYDCQGVDKDFCQGLIVKNLQKLKSAGYLETSDKEILSIGKSALANSSISKVGIIQVGFLKIPPLKWVSWGDDTCYNLDNTGFPIFFFWKYVNLLVFALVVIIAIVAVFVIKKIFSNKK